LSISGILRVANFSGLDETFHGDISPKNKSHERNFWDMETVKYVHTSDDIES